GTARRLGARAPADGRLVKSCRPTRAGMNGISLFAAPEGLQVARWRTWASVTMPRPAKRKAFSSRTRIEKGSRSSLPTPCRSRAGRLKTVARSEPSWMVERTENGSGRLDDISLTEPSCGVGRSKYKPRQGDDQNQASTS